MADLKAKIRLEGDARGADKAIKQTESGFKRLTKTIKSSAVAQVAALGASVLALRGLFRGIRTAISLSLEQAKVEKDLAAALHDTGKARDRLVKSLIAHAAGLQKVTAFGDEEIIKAQTLIGSFVKEEEAIKRATEATADLAAAKGFDLVAAADLVSKTLGSSTNALTRYGIEVTGAVGSTDRLNSLTENMAKVFGGRARAEVETMAGKLKQLSDVAGDVAEDIGDALVKNEEFGKTVVRVKKALEESGPALGEYSTLLVNLATEIIGGVVEKLTQLGNALGFVVAKIDGLRTDDVETSMKALESTAARLGITVEELNDRIAENIKNRRAATIATDDNTEAEGENTKAVEASAAAQEKLAKAVQDAASAYEDAVGSAKAFGEVTSVELANQISEISLALELQKGILGEHSVEYERLARVAQTKIESIRARIENLRRGFGDLDTETKKATGSVVDYGQEAETAIPKVARLAAANDRLASSAGRAASATAAASGGVAGAGFSRQRALFPGLSGGTFTTVRPVTVQPDGRIIP